jgi:hypothetical protein
MKKRTTTAGRTVKTRVRGSLDRKGPTKASVAIIINAVFLQSDRGTYEPEHLVAKLQKTHEALKSERERLQHKIDNASARN